MRGDLIVRFSICALIVLALGACCVIGGPLPDGPELELRVSALWNEERPPIGSTASVDFYVMLEDTGSWEPLALDEPYPIETATGALVDTFGFDVEVPLDGSKVAYRYEVELTVDGETYSPADYPSLSCESGVWWWYFRGRIDCSERER